MPCEPPRTVFRSLARPANAEGPFHRWRCQPQTADVSQCTQAVTARNLDEAPGRPGRAPGASAELRGGDRVGEDLAVERLGVDRQQRGRLTAMAADLAQGRDDVLALHRLEAGG